MKADWQERLQGWGSARPFTAFEALMWRCEAEPRLRNTIVALHVLDQAPDWDRLVATFDWVSRVAPRFRQRVVEPGVGGMALGMPVWAEDPDFSLQHHLRREKMAPGDGMPEVLELCSELAMMPFNRQRPPWEAVLIEGLADGSAFILLKLHHSTTDGLGFIQLLDTLHSQRRESDPDKPQPQRPPPAPLPQPEQLLRNQLREAMEQTPRAALRTAARALRSWRGLRDSPGLATDLAKAYAGSAARMLAPAPTAPSPLLQPRSGQWSFEVHQFPLAQLRRAAKACGGSVNDAFIAGLVDSFRRYHEKMDSAVTHLPVALPISTRRQDDPSGGNRFSGAWFAAPMNLRDPAELIRAVRSSVQGLRAEPALELLPRLAPALLMLPTPLLTQAMLKTTSANDLQASNVPGIDHPVYIAGSRVTQLYPFGPLPGCAAMAAMVSHDGQCCIGMNLDRSAVRDRALYARCLRESFDDILALATPGAAAAA